MAHKAIEMLKEDHQKVKKLFKELMDESAGKKQSELLEKIETELKIHTTLEEEIFYPAFREAGKKNEKLYYEALEEHRAVDKLVLPDVKKTDAGDARFLARAKVLKELVEHHVKEEEEELFPAAEKSMDAKVLEDLAGKMEKRKKELR